MSIQFGKCILSIQTCPFCPISDIFKWMSSVFKKDSNAWVARYRTRGMHVNNLLGEQLSKDGSYIRAYKNWDNHLADLLKHTQPRIGQVGTYIMTGSFHQSIQSSDRARDGRFRSFSFSNSGQTRRGRGGGGCSALLVLPSVSLRQNPKRMNIFTGG
jgi:hypothetical protein